MKQPGERPGSRRAGRFPVKKDVTRHPYDLGKSTGGALYKGVTLWELGFLLAGGRSNRHVRIP